MVRMPIAAQLGFGSQHSQSLEAWFVRVPGLKVAMPSTPYDAKGLIKTAIRDRNPVVFIENVSLYATKGQVPNSEDLVIRPAATFMLGVDHRAIDGRQSAAFLEHLKVILEHA